MTRFNDLIVRCDVNKDRQQSLSRFRTGLRSGIQREMLPHIVNPVEEVFQLALLGLGRTNSPTSARHGMVWGL